jgi:hypothetical protein
MGKSRSKGGCCGWFIAIVILGLVVGAIVYAVKKKIDNSDSDKPAPVPGPPGAIEQKYASALKTAMQFFDVQKCNHSFSFFNFYFFFLHFIMLLFLFIIDAFNETCFGYLCLFLLLLLLD